MTQVDRRSHTERGADRALNLSVPILAALLMARETVWGPGEALKCRRIGDGEGGVAVEKGMKIYYQDLWGVSYKSLKITFNTYETLSYHLLSFFCFFF